MAAGTAARGLSVLTLNAASRTGFTGAMAPFFEGAPRFLATLASARPFRDEADLFGRAAAIALAMPEADQLELLDAHPRIGAPQGVMSAASRVEQGYDRLQGGGADSGADSGADQAQGRLQADLGRLNAAYEARFGFRFVIFVAGRPPAEIVPLMEARLGGPRDAEMQTALADVVAIAFDRWRKAEVNES